MFDMEGYKNSWQICDNYRDKLIKTWPLWSPLATCKADQTQIKWCQTLRSISMWVFVHSRGVFYAFFNWGVRGRRWGWWGNTKKNTCAEFHDIFAIVSPSKQKREICQIWLTAMTIRNFVHIQITKSQPLPVFGGTLKQVRWVRQVMLIFKHGKCLKMSECT